MKVSCGPGNTRAGPRTIRGLPSASNRKQKFLGPEDHGLAGVRVEATWGASRRWRRPPLELPRGRSRPSSRAVSMTARSPVLRSWRWRSSFLRTLNCLASGPRRPGRPGGQLLDGARRERGDAVLLAAAAAVVLERGHDLDAGRRDEELGVAALDDDALADAQRRGLAGARASRGSPPLSVSPPSPASMTTLLSLAESMTSL
jgi:hypothetical protein